MEQEQTSMCLLLPVCGHVRLHNETKIIFEHEIQLFFKFIKMNYY